jgi:hypothetical protein
MPPKKTSLAELRVNAPASPSVAPVAPLPAATAARPYKKKTFEILPVADREFEILRAETGKTGIELAAEALNLLFQKYGKPQVA